MSDKLTRKSWISQVVGWVGSSKNVIESRLRFDRSERTDPPHATPLCYSLFKGGECPNNEDYMDERCVLWQRFPRYE